MLRPQLTVPALKSQSRHQLRGAHRDSRSSRHQKCTIIQLPMTHHKDHRTHLTLFNQMRRKMYVDLFYFVVFDCHLFSLCCYWTIGLISINSFLGSLYFWCPTEIDFEENKFTNIAPSWTDGHSFFVTLFDRYRSRRKVGYSPVKLNPITHHPFLPIFHSIANFVKLSALLFANHRLCWIAANLILPEVDRRCRLALLRTRKSRYLARGWSTCLRKSRNNGKKVKCSNLSISLACTSIRLRSNWWNAHRCSKYTPCSRCWVSTMLTSPPLVDWWESFRSRRYSILSVGKQHWII